MVELVEIEMREMLSDFGYNGNKIPMVMGSALKALNDDNSEIGRKYFFPIILNYFNGIG